MPVRKLRPSDIELPESYVIEVVEEGLTAPISMVFAPNGQVFVADAGVTDGSGKVLRKTSEGFAVLADGFRPPLTGICWHEEALYVSHRGSITRLELDGKRQDIITGLPSWGDHHNNQVTFGPDGKMYFGQGTATNSGVVGRDNDWIHQHPFVHDYPGADIRVVGDNFQTPNLFAPASKESTTTGAFSPFGIPTRRRQEIRGIRAASGSILRANPDGSQLELVAWGLRNPFRVRFDTHHRLYATNHGMDERGSRPVVNAPDEFHEIFHGAWYGWPDFAGGMSVSNAVFQSDGRPQPSPLLAGHPMRPPKALALFPPHSAAMGFDFNVDPQFARVGETFFAEFGSGAPRTTNGKPAPQVGHRISRLDPETGALVPFARNRFGYAASHTGDGGFERPIDVVFRPDGLYVVDFGLRGKGGSVPQTGVVWRISRNR